MADALLETRRLRRFFGGIQAVKDVSLRLTAGQIVGLIGPNGAGKTTLFNLIAGAIPPQAGEVLFRGEAITARRPHVIARLGIARTFQTTRLFHEMTVLENVMVGRHTRSRAGFLSGMFHLPRGRREEREILDAARGLLEEFGLGARSEEPAGSLPFGLRRRVEIVRALAAEPTLLLLDEPAAGLNVYETHELSQLILGIRRRGVTCLVVEHDMSLVMDISDQVVVLNEGAKIAEGTPHEVQRNGEVVRIYLGAAHA